MALNSLPIPVDAARDKKAAELVKTAHTWPVVTLRKPWGSFKVGDQFLQTPNGYRCNAVACECPDYVTWGNICKHIRAAATYLAREAAGTPIPEQDARPSARTRLAVLFPPCQTDGCGDLADGLDGKYCGKCHSDREWAARRQRSVCQCGHAQMAHEAGVAECHTCKAAHWRVRNEAWQTTGRPPAGEVPPRCFTYRAAVAAR